MKIERNVLSSSSWLKNYQSRLTEKFIDRNFHIGICRIHSDSVTSREYTLSKARDVQATFMLCNFSLCVRVTILRCFSVLRNIHIKIFQASKADNGLPGIFIKSLCILKADRPHLRDYSTNGSVVRGRTDGWTDGQTDGRTLPSTLSPSLHGR